MSNDFYRYPFDEFQRHYDELRASGERSDSFEGNVIRVFEYMRRVCANDDEARWKASRFMLMMQYIAEHIADFDRGDFAVNGSPAVGALVGQHLVRAVHEVYSTADLSALGYGPSPAEIMELATKYRPKADGETAEA